MCYYISAKICSRPAGSLPHSCAAQSRRSTLSVHSILSSPYHGVTAQTLAGIDAGLPVMVLAQQSILEGVVATYRCSSYVPAGLNRACISSDPGSMNGRRALRRSD
jgi:hypothetical protein